VTVADDAWLADEQPFEPGPPGATRQPIRHTRLGDPVAVYEYRRLDGDLAFVVCRFDPKEFRPAQLRGGRWVWNLRDAPVLPYRLADVDRALAAGDTIYVVDGEKDADAIAAAGGVATCCARAQGWTAELAEQLTGARRIRIVADRDGGTGARQAREVAKLLVEAGAIASCDVELVQAREGKDAHDHLAAGFGLDDLERLTSEPEAGDSWQPVDLSADRYAQPTERPIVAGLIYRGKRHALIGPPEASKTLLALLLGLEWMRADHGRLALIDFEMGPNATRLLLTDLGATIDEIADVHYVAPDSPPTEQQLAAITAAGVTLAIIDAAAGAYDTSGLDDNKRGDVERFARSWIRPLWRTHGCTTVVLDHVVKATDARGRYGIGSERKLGGVDVQLGLEAITQLHRGSSGLIRISTHKDRPAHLRRPHAAELHLVSDPGTHRISWELREPAATTDVVPGNADATWQPTALMEKISRWLAHQGEPVSRNTIERAGLGKKAQYVRKAIDALVAGGYITETGGARGARMHTHVRPFTSSSSDLVPPRPDEDEVTSSPTSSDLVSLQRDEVADEDEVARLAAVAEELGL
jgi:hypothetical protein